VVSALHAATPGPSNDAPLSGGARRASTRASTVVLAGRPGSGKGTQASAVARELGFAHVATGDLVRMAATVGSREGSEFAALLDEGRLVPDDAILGLLATELDRIWPKRGVVLDGFPRTVAQARALDRLRPPDLVVELDVPARRIIERLVGRGRHDDSAAAIRARLHVYESETRPMLRWYDARGALATVDGDRPLELVTTDVLAVITQSRSRADAQLSP
jgi:adenylate kinase